MRKIIRTTGEIIPVTEKMEWEEVKKQIGLGQRDLLEIVRLRRMPPFEPEVPRNLHIMLVDEEGAIRNPPQPVNHLASFYYWANCVPGTTWHIRGDVYICPDSDFE